LATIEVGFSATVRVAGESAVWFRVAGVVLVMVELLSVALIVALPTVVELVMVAVYVPAVAPGVVPLMCSPASVVVNVTLSPSTPIPVLSSTVAVAVVVETPFATMLVGDTVTVSDVPVPAAWAVPPSSPQASAAPKRHDSHLVRRDIGATSRLISLRRPPQVLIFNVPRVTFAGP
jgi:hypothetical protein